MNEMTAAELETFKKTANDTLASIKPTLSGLAAELKRQARQVHDHEDFLVHEFRDLVRAIDGLSAQIARLA